MYATRRLAGILRHVALLPFVQMIARCTPQCTHVLFFAVPVLLFAVAVVRHNTTAPAKALLLTMRSIKCCSMKARFVQGSSDAREIAATQRPPTALAVFEQRGRAGWRCRLCITRCSRCCVYCSARCAVPCCAALCRAAQELGSYLVPVLMLFSNLSSRCSREVVRAAASY